MLAATAVFADDADLNRMLTAFGYAGTPPLGPHTTDLGMFDVEGVSVSLEVTRVVSPGRPGEARTLRLTAGVYVTAELIAHAARLEAWLDAHHVAMRRAADSR